MNYKLLSLAALICLSISCKKLDNIIPQIKELSLNDKTEDIVIESGKPYFIRVKAEDNKSLANFSLAQKKGLTYEENVFLSGFDYTYSNVYAQSFSSKTETYNFTFPTDKAAGAYRVIINAVDENDNKALERTLDFVVTSPDAPKNTISAKQVESDQLTLIRRRGELIELQGKATDATDIRQTKIDIVGQRKSLFSKAILFNGTSDTSIDLSKLTDPADTTKLLRVSIPATAENGDYKLAITTTNKAGHSDVKIFKLKIVF